MNVLHVHVVEDVVHVFQRHRPSVQQRDERIEVFLLLGSLGLEGGGFVDLVGSGDEGRAGGEAFERDLFVGFDGAER